MRRGVRSRRHQTGQYAARQARRVPRPAHRGGGCDRRGWPAANQRRRAGEAASSLRRRRQLFVTRRGGFRGLLAAPQPVRQGRKAALRRQGGRHRQRCRRGGGFDPADFTYRLAATFTKPGVYTPDTDFVASLIGDREVLDPYTRSAVIAQVGFNHMFSEHLSARLFAYGEHARFDDDFGERDFNTVGFLGGLILDRRDNSANATEGYYIEALADPFFEFNYGNAALRATVEGRVYYGFLEDDLIVAAARLKLGSVVGSPVDETAPDKLFFAGGGGSVRGYAYRSIGIPSPEGGVTGGRSLIEGSAELRARVTDSIGVVAFADAGYVAADSFPEFSEDLKVGVGAGLRYITGLGPIRLDLAMPLDPGPDDPDVAFYIGLGQAF
ncbi:BamA/TamA family outer membrane protein [Mesorhizobium sp. WSM2240]|uniref:BamA/TamA family outer membrane protein n=1 Tax=Mesorhizobium sp. WSM2240 TaxID=3228851 RepID=A0AAU8CXS4_9HYPH